jgi:hypothetical protein
MIADVMRRGGGLTLAVVVLLLCEPIAAHDLERTKVTLTFARDGRFVVEVANDPDWLLLRLEPFVVDYAGIEAATPRAGGVDPAGRDRRLAALAPVFVDRIVLFVDGREVRPASAEYVEPAADAGARLPPLAIYRLRGRVTPDARALRWFYGLVVDPYPLTLVRADGVAATEWVGGRAWSAPKDLTRQFVPPTRLAIVGQYLWLGYTHIMPKGLDHVLFVLGLFLLSLQLAPILIQVTTFTVAHSITLGLSIYGFVSLPSRIVEPLIALSIAYVAVENLVTSRLKRWRLGLVFLFGLLHGLGFAGALAELGLPRREFLTALLSFNLGVEGGQLTVIGLAVLAAGGICRRDWYRRRVVVPASLAIAGVGVWWTVGRLM